MSDFLYLILTVVLFTFVSLFLDFILKYLKIRKGIKLGDQFLDLLKQNNHYDFLNSLSCFELDALLNYLGYSKKGVYLAAFAKLFGFDAWYILLFFPGVRIILECILCLIFLILYCI